MGSKGSRQLTVHSRQVRPSLQERPRRQGHPPKKKAQKFKRWADWPQKPKPPIRCPYCLESLPPIEFDSPPLILCPICYHDIPHALFRSPLHRFNRAQRWTLLACEMKTIWKDNHRDVMTYHNYQSQNWNPDFGEAKQRLINMLIDLEEVLRLRMKFMEAEGELDVLVAEYLKNKGWGRGNLGDRLILARPWRLRAMDLSREGGPVRSLAEFQLEYVKSLSWGVFGYSGDKGAIVAMLVKRLEKLSPSQSIKWA